MTTTVTKNYKTLTVPKSRISTSADNFLVYLSSASIIGGITWVPVLYVWLYKKWKNTPNDEEHKKKRKLYRTIFITAALVTILGPHRNRKIGKFLNFYNWRILKAWENYASYEVISEIPDGKESKFRLKKDQAIFAVVPHGIIPVPLGFLTLTKAARDVLGEIRPVVASATRCMPAFRTVLEWAGCIDANRSSVQKVLAKGDSIGISPGGIAEMFEGYPKPGRLPNDECVILKSRKGFVRMALKNNIPVIPMYCFGGSKTFRRLQLPTIVEKISNFLRISIVIIFGKFGLFIPFQQRLLAIVGEPIHPPNIDGSILEDSQEFKDIVDKLHARFCDELTGIFDRHKHGYGWGHKRLHIV